MAKYVVKRDGSKEAFDKEKVKRSIIVNAQDAGLPEKRIKKVAKKVLNAVIRFAEEKKEIATAEIKKKILIEFDTIEPSVSKVWREFDEKRGVTII